MRKTIISYWNHPIMKTHILQVSIAGRNEKYLVAKVSQQVLQAFQYAFTPISTVELSVIKDLEAFKEDSTDRSNLEILTVEETAVYGIEEIKIDSLN
ncbi:hypothetical protein [Peijinzhouia sedimentorum]